MMETEWFLGRGVDEHQRAYWSRIAGELAVAIAIGICAVWTTRAYAEPFAVVSDGANVRITLHSGEKCALDGVTNLPNRAVWAEGEKRFEGCWGYDPAYEIVRLYFADKTVVALPVSLFAKIAET